MTHEQIDNISDGELCRLAGERIGYPVKLDAAGCFAAMLECGRQGWQMTLVHRAGLAVESVASVQHTPGFQAEDTCRHLRPEIACFRVLLYAFAPRRERAELPPAEAVAARLAVQEVGMWKILCTDHAAGAPDLVELRTTGKAAANTATRKGKDGYKTKIYAPGEWNHADARP